MLVEVFYPVGVALIGADEAAGSYIDLFKTIKQTLFDIVDERYFKSTPYSIFFCAIGYRCDTQHVLDYSTKVLLLTRTLSFHAVHV